MTDWSERGRVVASSKYRSGHFADAVYFLAVSHAAAKKVASAAQNEYLSGYLATPNVTTYHP